MASGIWTAVSGAAAQAQSVDSIANNLANQDTLAFKKDAPAFREYLGVLEREKGGQDIPQRPIKDRDLYPSDGKDQAFVIVDGTYTNFKQGGIRVTQQPYDLAIDGPGFLEVSTPSGVRYTRQGSLKVAMDGRLVTTDGHPVLSAQPGGLAANAAPAQPVAPGQRAPTPAPDQNLVDAARFINLRDRGTNINITQSGEIYAGDELVARLSVVEFNNPNQLRKVGASLFENKRADTNLPQTPQKTTLHQGMLETSNVNPIEEMTNLIKANRLFENDMKAMKTYNDLMGREANDIGKL